MCCLVEEVKEEEIPDWRADTPTQPTMEIQAQKKELTAVLEVFSSTLKGKLEQTNAAEHRIELSSSKPIRLPPYRIPHAYRDAVNQELQEMEESGIIEPSNSEWAAPIVVAKKKDGSIRLCVDYRKLNAMTPIDPYPMPKTDDLIDRLGKAPHWTWHGAIGKYLWQRRTDVKPPSLHQRDCTNFVSCHLDSVELQQLSRE